MFHLETRKRNVRFQFTQVILGITLLTLLGAFLQVSWTINKHLSIDFGRPATATVEFMFTFDPLASSMAKLRNQLEPGQEEKFDRTKPIYIDIGLNNGADTNHHLSKGYSVISVDAFKPWVTKGKEKFSTEIATNRLLLFNVGVAVEEAEAMPLYYKEEGSVIASFEKKKGCQGRAWMNPNKCFHTDVPVVRCESLLYLLKTQPEIMKVDIEMFHHACVRGLHRVDSAILPKYVCWEEHDKPFGPGEVERPITDAKLILGMFELGYSGIKLVLQGPGAHRYYRLEKGMAGTGGSSGALPPEEMMHYRSNESNEDGKFDTRWRDVPEILMEGIFGKSGNGWKRSFYFDVCMKLSDNTKEVRAKRQDPESFPLASYAAK